MNNLDLACPICNENFNSTTRVPKVIPQCGHTLCHPCLGQVMKAVNATCPFDMIPIKASDPSQLAKNRFILEQLEDKIEVDKCIFHQKTYEYMCLEHSVKLCSDCAVLGEHRGHRIQKLSEYIGELKRKGIEMEKVLEDVIEQEKEANGKIHCLLEDRKKMAKREVEDRFAKVIQDIIHEKDKAMDTVETHFEGLKEGIKTQSTKVKTMFRGLSDNLKEILNCNTNFKLDDLFKLNKVPEAVENELNKLIEVNKVLENANINKMIKMVDAEGGQQIGNGFFKIYFEDQNLGLDKLMPELRSTRIRISKENEKHLFQKLIHGLKFQINWVSSDSLIPCIYADKRKNYSVSLVSDAHKELEKITQIDQLNLGLTEFSTYDFVDIASVIRILAEKLNKLEIDIYLSCKINLKSKQNLLAALEITKLKELHWSSDIIHLELARGILAKNPNFQKLDLEFVEDFPSPDDLASFFEALSEQKTIKALKIKIFGTLYKDYTDLKLLNTCIVNLTTLEEFEFRLTNTSVILDGFFNTIEILATMKKLKSLSLVMGKSFWLEDAYDSCEINSLMNMLSTIKLQVLYLDFFEWTLQYQNTEFSLPYLKELHLDLGNCIITDESERDILGMISEELKNLKELEKLHLLLAKWNELTDFEIIELSDSLKGLSKLQEFHFNVENTVNISDVFGVMQVTSSTTNITGDSLIIMCINLAEIKSLNNIKLDFSGNKFVHEDSKKEAVQILKKKKDKTKDCQLSIL